MKTYSRQKFRGEIANWHCRVSEHGPEDATFDEFWEKLGVNKGENETQYVYSLCGGLSEADLARRYVEEVKKATLIKQISPTQSIWSMYYRFPPPVTPRVFTVLQIVHFKETAPRTGYVILRIYLRAHAG